METTINGKTVKVYKTSYIKKLYSDMVKDYLNKGYILNIRTMQSSQSSELTHTDVTKDGGKTVIRIWVARNTDPNTWRDIYEINEELHTISNDSISPIWNNKGKMLSTVKFYSINSSTTYDLQDNRSFVKNPKAAKDIYDIGCNRRKNRLFYPKVVFKANKEILPLVNKQKGYKTTKFSDIESVEKEYWLGQENKFKGYTIHFSNGKRDLLFTFDK